MAQNQLSNIYSNLLTLRKSRKSIESFLLFQLYSTLTQPQVNQQFQSQDNIDPHLLSQYEKTLQIVLSKFRASTELLQDMDSQETHQLKWDLFMETKLNEDLRGKIMNLEAELAKCHSVIRQAICIQEQEDDYKDTTV